MKFCTKCGAELNEASKFCTACGAEIPVQAVEQQPEVIEEPAAVPAVEVAETEAQEPVAVVKKGNPKLRMLFMSFLAFICVMTIPVLKAPIMGGIDINMTDVAKIGVMGFDIPEVSRGDVVEYVDEKISPSFDEAIEAIEDRKTKNSVVELKGELLDACEEMDGEIVEAVDKVKLACTIAFIFTVFAAVGFILSIVAAMANKRWMYFFTHTGLLVLFAALAVGILVMMEGGMKLIGIGTWISMAVIAAGAIVSLKK